MGCFLVYAAPYSLFHVSWLYGVSFRLLYVMVECGSSTVKFPLPA